MQLTETSVQQLTRTQERQPFTCSEQLATDVVDVNQVNQSRHDSRSNLAIIAKSDNSILYWGLLGHIIIQKKRKCLKRPGAPYVDTEKCMPDEKVITIGPSFSRYSFHMSFAAGFRLVPRSLRIDQILPSKAPIFNSVKEGDLGALQAALDDGSVSPFVTDETGATLLHVCTSPDLYEQLIASLTRFKHAAFRSRTQICRFLIELGVDVDRANSFGL